MLATWGKQGLKFKMDKISQLFQKHVKFTPKESSDHSNFGGKICPTFNFLPGNAGFVLLAALVTEIIEVLYFLLIVTLFIFKVTNNKRKLLKLLNFGGKNCPPLNFLPENAGFILLAAQVTEIIEVLYFLLIVTYSYSK